MQKLIAKYGLAAHLALLAVAPLFLFPFSGEDVIAIVLLWLSVPATLWVFFEPSVRPGEMPHNARARVAHAAIRDPLLWVMLFAVALTGLMALNGGIALSYDAEAMKWCLASARFPILPGCVDGFGFLPFAGAVAATVSLIGCRHALGRAARMAYLFLSSALSGIAACLAIFRGVALVPSFAGIAFALELLGGTVALFAAYERKWRMAMPFFAFAIGGTAAGMFAFSSVFGFSVLAVAEILLLLYVFAYSRITLAATEDFKVLVTAGVALVIGGLFATAAIPDAVLQARIGALRDLSFFPDGFLKARSVLSAVALKSWLSRLWVGTGIGSFPIDFRFTATPEDWLVVRGGVTAVPNGGWQLLVECGIVGALLLILPFGLVLLAYAQRMRAGLTAQPLPHPACFLLPFALVSLLAVGLFDSSVLNAGVLLVAGSLSVLSARSFPKVK